MIQSQVAITRLLLVVRVFGLYPAGRGSNTDR